MLALELVPLRMWDTKNSLVLVPNEVSYEFLYHIETAIVTEGYL